MKTEFNILALLRGYLSDNAHLINPREYETLDGWARSGNIKGLASADSLFDPALHGVEAFRFFRQVSAFVKKSKDFTDDDVATAACADSFLSAEQRCRDTNLRLDMYYTEQIPSDLRFAIERMQRTISSVLGDYASFQAALPSLVRVTSGATATRSRRRSLPFMKMRGRIECTLGCAPFVELVAETLGFKPKFRVLNFNRVGTVPKSWKTHRTIACEPVGNVPIQLAFDGYTKRRLRRIGVDLSSQTRNQELAKEGSVTGALATIDLSAASDTVSLNAIHLLFPEEWARFLMAIRSSHYIGPFGMGKYHKFSSMGNGTTFCVETLIFAAACIACKPNVYAVYGDDIIIDTACVDKLMSILAYLGFTVNTDKSFTTGPFRESCGGDYYHGENVTPFYYKHVSSPGDLCHVVNGLASICNPGGKLSKLLLEIIIAEKLPLVPANSDSRSGVFVDVYTAYLRGLLRKAPARKAYDYQTMEFRGLVSIAKTRRIRDIRSYALWFIGRSGDSDKSCLERDYQRLIAPGEVTEVPSDRVVTRLRWIPWFPRIVPTGQLSCWSDFLHSEISDRR